MNYPSLVNILNSQANSPFNNGGIQLLNYPTMKFDTTNKNVVSDVNLSLSVNTNLGVIFQNIKTPKGFSGPYISGWGYSSKFDTYKTLYIGNISDLYVKKSSTPEGMDNGHIYGFTIDNININSKINIGFILSYYNKNSNFELSTDENKPQLYENNVNTGIHYLYVSKITPLIKSNKIEIVLTPYETFTYKYNNKTSEQINEIEGLKGYYPITGLNTQSGYSSAYSPHVPSDILLDYLQHIK